MRTTICNLGISILGSAIVVVLDRLDVFGWILGISLLDLPEYWLARPVPVWATVMVVFIACLVVVTLLRRTPAPSAVVAEKSQKLSPEDDQVLEFLLQHPMERVPLAELQEAVGLGPAELRLLIHRLENVNYINVDKRSMFSRIALTRMGKNYLSRKRGR